MGRAPRATAAVTSVTGGLLLAWSAYLHFHLWQSAGYRHIPTIGTLFILQAMTGFVLAFVTIVVRRAWAAFVGAGFSASTAAGLLVSIYHGLFGFKDSWAAPFARLTFAIELIALVLLSLSVVLRIAGSHHSP